MSTPVTSEIVASGRTASALKVSSLIRGGDSSPRHLKAVLRLIGLVAEWGTDAELDVTVRSAGRSGRTDFLLSPVGTVPEDWKQDVGWALRDIAVLANSAAAPATMPRHVLELKMSRDLPEPEFDLGLAYDEQAPGDRVTAELERQRRIRGASPWPQGYVAAVADLFDLTIPGLAVRYRLSAASDVERALLDEALERTWPDSRGSRRDYMGTAVRIRVLVGAQRSIPARARAVLRQWGSGVTPLDLVAGEAAAAWHSDPSTLLGRAIPVGAAVAMLRLPVVSDGAFPGLATSAAPLGVRALDPVPPKPFRAVRLGKAQTATGRWIDASVDLGDLVQHGFIQGSSGSGKSTLLVSLALAIQAAGGSYTLLDPEGSTVEALVRQTPREFADRTRAVRHGMEALDVPVNIFSSTVETEVMIDLFAEMIQRAFDPAGSGIVGPRWRRWFALIATGVSALLGDEATLVSVAAIASDMDRVRKLGVRLKTIAPEISSRILSEYGRLSNDSSGDMTSWAASKFQPLLASAPTRQILGTAGQGIDVLAAMETGTSLAIDLGMHRLGTTGARVVGALWLLKFWAAVHERQNRDRPHVILVDEAHLFQYGALPQLLAQARKFGIGVIVATQHLGQLTGELADALESNTGTFISLRSGLQSAGRASARLEGWPVERLVRLPNLTAAATISRDGIVSSPFTLRIDHYSRMGRLAKSGVVGPEVASSIFQTSEQLAAVASGGALPLTDKEILTRLEEPMAIDEAAPRFPEPKPTFIDAWLAKRSEDIPAARATDALDA